MYSVSSAFKLAMKTPIQEHRLTGTIGSISFSEVNVVDGSFSISNQSTDTSDVVLGSCYVGELQAEFTGISIDWSDWVGKVITPSFGLKIGPGANDWENVPLGVFKVAKATHTQFGVQVTAYDNMIKFDKKFKKSTFLNVSGMYNIISRICTNCGVTLGMTRAQIEALPNGSRSGIRIYGSEGKKSEFANDIQTHRDLLFWCAQTLGCFATINRAGQLEFRPYNQTVVDNISDAHRIEGATFEDYITHYVGIYVENLNDNTEDYYGYDSTALQAEITETEGEITSDQNRILELEASLEEWAYKLAHGQCTQEEYDAAVAEIDAELKPLITEVKQLGKRLKWLQDALAQSGDDGSDMVLGANPLLMDSNLTTRDSERRAVLSALDAISYTPFTADVVCGPHYDLGDVIQFSGGLYNSASDTFGCVMAWNYTHNAGTQMQGFGVDPAIPQVRTKTQKEVYRANQNSSDAARSTVGTIDPSDPPTADDSVPGKNGDTYTRQTSKTVRKNVSKTYPGWQTYSWAVNNTYHYSYDKLTVNCNSGNFIACFVAQPVTGQSWCVAGSKSRTIGRTNFVVKVPVDAQIPNFTASVSDVSEHNEGEAIGGWGENGTAFFYNQTKILNNARTHYYYYASCTGGGMSGGIRYEEQRPDYEFDTVEDFEEALENDLVNIPTLYDGSDGTVQYYNDGTGGDSAWKKNSVVTGVDQSDEAGGTDNNGMVVNTETQQISLKNNVVRAWYKADPPQTERNFSQLCVRYTGSPDKAVKITAQGNNGWSNTKVTKDDDSVYKIKCHGHYVAANINYVTYKLTGLTAGKKYYFNFKCNFSDNAQFDYDMSHGCGLVFNTSTTLSSGNWSGDEDTFTPSTGYYAFKRRPESWYADFELTASSSTMYMHVCMKAETNTDDCTFTMSEFVVSQKERQLIRNIYLYDYTAKEWLKYKPFSGSTSGGDEGGSVVEIDPAYSTGGKLADFIIDGEPGALFLPIASDSVLGGIKVGQNLTIGADGTLNAEAGGVDDYDDLTNRPSVNDIILTGNKTSADLGMVITLTQAEYNALSTAEKNDPNKVYYISDAHGGDSGVNELDELTDVDISNPVDGQKLVYNGTSGKWENVTEQSTSAEIISITAGNGTSSRHFQLSKTPKRITVSYNSADSTPWLGHWDFIWGDDVTFGLANAKGIPGTGATICRGNITYGSDGKSFTITGANAFQAWNLASGLQGRMLVQY